MIQYDSHLARKRISDNSFEMTGIGYVEQFKSLLAGRLAMGLRSTFLRYGLRRDLELPLKAPAAKIPISVRPLAPGDIPELLPSGETALESRENTMIAWRRDFLRKIPDGCFVAVDQRDGTPCYMQWLIHDNKVVRKLGGFPELVDREALLENAFTPVKYRGLGIMSAAMALIAEQAAASGARYVLTFVGDDNIASLKGAQRAGFNPHLMNRRVRMAFGCIKVDRFALLPDNDPRRNLRF